MTNSSKNLSDAFAYLWDNADTDAGLERLAQSFIEIAYITDSFSTIHFNKSFSECDALQREIIKAEMGNFIRFLSWQDIPDDRIVNLIDFWNKFQLYRMSDMNS